MRPHPSLARIALVLTGSLLAATPLLEGCGSSADSEEGAVTPGQTGASSGGKSSGAGGSSGNASSGNTSSGGKPASGGASAGGASAGGASAGGASAGGASAGGASAGGASAGGASAGGASAGGSSAGGAAQAGSGQGGNAQAGSSTGGSAQGGTSQGGAAQAGAGGGAGGPPACDPPCAGTQFCSSQGTCIEQGTCLADDDCDNGTVCDEPNMTCVPGSACGVTKLAAEEVPPNLLIVLDRSCSMTAKVGGLTKWQIATAAINTLTTSYASKIRFGLTLFPDRKGGNCTQEGPFLVPVAPGNEPQIQSIMTASLKMSDPNFPDGPCVTNIDTGIEQATLEPSINDTSRASFVLLITDGKQSSCKSAGGDNGTTKMITDLNAKGVKTFVVGFGGEVDPAQMNTFADAGGVPSGNPATRYYKAEDQASLDAALNAIGKKTLSCTLNVTEPPPDPNGIYVFFNESTQVQKDASHADGWDYDAASQKITFYGPACDSLQSGSVNQLDVVFGCPGGSSGSGGAGGAPAGCVSGIACDVTNLCPPDASMGQDVLCQAGCCVYGKF